MALVLAIGGFRGANAIFLAPRQTAALKDDLSAILTPVSWSRRRTSLSAASANARRLRRCTPTHSDWLSEWSRSHRTEIRTSSRFPVDAKPMAIGCSPKPISSFAMRLLRLLAVGLRVCWPAAECNGGQYCQYNNKCPAQHRFGSSLLKTQTSVTSLLDRRTIQPFGAVAAGRIRRWPHSGGYAVAENR